MVSNVIGNWNVLHNNGNESICVNTDEFSKAIIASQNESKETVDSMAEQAYQNVLKVYNTKVMAEQYIKKYEPALDKRGIQHDLILYIPTNNNATVKAVV